MNSLRIGVIFDRSVRPDTTGTYCLESLRELAQVTWLAPGELKEVAAADFDLFVRIDDGLDYSVPPALRPLAWWAIDTHLDFERCRRVASLADRTFVAQRPAVNRLRESGIDDVSWLPLACDPTRHGQAGSGKHFDIAFVGNVAALDSRAALLANLADAFPSHFIGRAEPSEIGAIYSSAQVVVNRSVGHDLNMRVFEALCSGTPLVTDELPPESGLAELFDVGEHLLTYGDDVEAADVIRRLLVDNVLREHVGAAGREAVLERHTYHHRMQTLLDECAALVGSVPTRAPKPPAYFDHPRPEVAALVPSDACDILDVGCGAGGLGAYLKSRGDVRVTGVEREPAAIEVARSRLDDILERDLESGVGPLPEAAFDAVICADVLEHVREPERLLRDLRESLRPGGRLIVSLPNVQHHSVLTALLEGDFSYEPAGLLDRDHVRFFTRRESERLLFRAGFDVDSVTPVPTPGESFPDKSEDSLQAGGLLMTGLTPERLRDFHAYQHLLTARLREDAGRMTSIVVLTHNNLSDTIACLDSVRRRTVAPYEMIVVDNGSTDGTVEYLRSQPDLTLVENAENVGFPRGCNQGIEVASGEDVLLLNNDTVVTTGWLTRMQAVRAREPDVGLVGPCSNNVSGWQQVGAEYRSELELERFAWEWWRSHANVAEQVGRLVGFCLLISREVLDAVGHLDERFGVGCYEDDDYCRRAAEAGFRLAIARDAFVHHRGSQTFQFLGIDLGGLLTENERLYNEKWRKPKEETQLERPVHTAPVPGRLSLCMIVRDNEATLPAALESVPDIVDEMIIVDTGSTDRTAEIARDAGAEVHHFPWCDDFSAARNESLRHATGEWLFWMDSDDVLPAESGRRLRETVSEEHPANVLGYVMPVECPGREGTPDLTIVDHVKLFRNDPRLFFEGRIHEQVLGSIRRVGGEVRRLDAPVIHAGADRSDAGRRRKTERDLRILRLDLAERPDHPFVLFNFGMTHADAGEHRTAVWYLRRSLAVSGPSESHVPKAAALLVGSLVELARYSEAEQACEAALARHPSDPELLFRSALLFQSSGRYAQAVDVWERLVDSADADEFRSRDAGLTGHKARHNLALALSGSGRSRDAEREWISVTEQTPDFAPAWQALADIYVRDERWGDAEKLLDGMPDRDVLRADRVLLSVAVKASRGEGESVLSDLQAEWGGGHDPRIGDELARRLFEAGRYAEAEQVLTELLGRSADPDRVRRNLATVYEALAAHSSLPAAA